MFSQTFNAFLFDRLFGIEVALPYPDDWPKIHGQNKTEDRRVESGALLRGLFGLVADPLALAEWFVSVLTEQNFTVPVSDGSRVVTLRDPLMLNVVRDVFLELAAKDERFIPLASRVFEAVFRATWQRFVAALGSNLQQRDERGYQALLTGLLIELNGLLLISRRQNYDASRWLSRDVHGLLREGRIGLVEELIRVFGWTGAFDFRLWREVPIVMRAPGGSPEAIGVRDSVLAMIQFDRVSGKSESLDLGVRAALWSLPDAVHGSLEPAYGVAAARQARALIALDLREPLSIREDSSAINYGYSEVPEGRDLDPEAPQLTQSRRVRREMSTRYLMARKLWEALRHGEEAPKEFSGFNPERPPSGVFHRVPEPILRFSEDLTAYPGVIISATPEQEMVIELLIGGAWAKARLLLEWLGWTGAFSADLEHYHKGVREGHIQWASGRRVFAVLRNRFLLASFVIGYNRACRDASFWGTVAALGQQLLADPELVRQCVQRQVDACYFKRVADLNDAIEVATLPPLPGDDGFGGYAYPYPPAPPCPPELVARRDQYVAEKLACVDYLSGVIREMIDQSLARALELGQPIALYSFDE